MQDPVRTHAAGRETLYHPWPHGMYLQLGVFVERKVSCLIFVDRICVDPQQTCVLVQDKINVNGSWESEAVDRQCIRVYFDLRKHQMYAYNRLCFGESHQGRTADVQWEMFVCIWGHMGLLCVCVQHVYGDAMYLIHTSEQRTRQQ